MKVIILYIILNFVIFFIGIFLGYFITKRVNKYNGLYDHLISREELNKFVDDICGIESKNDSLKEKI